MADYFDPWKPSPSQSLVVFTGATDRMGAPVYSSSSDAATSDLLDERAAFAHKKRKMKRQRQRRTAGGVLGGVIVGALTLGPVGAIAGGVVGGVATKKICKVRERRVERAHYDTVQSNGNLLAYSGTVA